MTLRSKCGAGLLSFTSAGGAVCAGVAVAVLACGGDTGAADSIAESARAPEGSGGTGLRWEVTLAPLEGVARVHLRVPGAVLGDRRELELRFADLRRAPGALRRIEASASGQPLTLTAPATPGGPYRVRTPAGARELVVDYEIEPVFFPPGSGDAPQPAEARSRLTAELGVLRTSSLFARVEPAGELAHIEFGLPPGWVAVTPWADAGPATWRARDAAATEYLGVGPFRVAEVRIDDQPVRIGVAPGVEGIGPAQVERLVRAAQRAAGMAPPGAGGAIGASARLPAPNDAVARAGAGRVLEVRSILVVPFAFMRGGAAGSRSTVQLPAAEVLAHELFHWWMHPRLVAPDGRWFQEGFTSFYGPELARRAGLLADSAARACLADLEAEMRALERDAPVALHDAATAYAESLEASRLVYSKGAVLAFLMDSTLRRQGRSLDDLVRPVFAAGAAGLDTRALLRLLQGNGDDEVVALLRGAVLEGRRLPETGLGPAPRTSGCARLPPQGGRPE